MLTDIFEQIEKGGAKSTKHGGMLDTGVLVLPKLPRDAGDRNRTSPFAFTGNKFEFRAVSSNQSIGYPNIVLNLAVTESIDYIATELEKAVKGGKTLNVAVAELLPKVIKENKQIIFNGNGYSREWEKEAGKRGLLNLKNTVDALPQLVTKDAIKLFETYKILNERELHARYEIMVETYNKTVNVEGQLMVLMANRYILPAAFEYQKQVAQSVAAVKSAGGKSDSGRKVLDWLTKKVDVFKDRTDKLEKALAHEGASSEKHAKHFRDVVVPAMAALRETGDELELELPHESWPLPPTARCCSSSRTGRTGGAGSVGSSQPARSAHPAHPALCMAGHECHHCKQWIGPDEAHDCWSTTEAALTADLSEDLRDAWDRLRETAAAFGDQRILRVGHRDHVLAGLLLLLRPSEAKLPAGVRIPRPCSTSPAGATRRT